LVGLLLWTGADGAYVAVDATVDGAAPADVILVLGCPSLDHGQLSACVQVRAHHAADLYRRGLARQIILSGGQTGPGPPEAVALAGVLAADGVPAAAITLEAQARDTVENIAASRVLMRAHGWRTAILVTEPHHIRRALLIARDAGLAVVPSPATTSPSWHDLPERLHNLARDALALQIYQVRRLVGLVPW